MVNQIFFEIKFIGDNKCKKFNCSRDELRSTVKMLKEYNKGFKLIEITPWRLQQC